MRFHRIAALALLAVAPAAPPALAASFDCTKAATPFETAICDNPDLSTADEVLAKSFATATGGLSKDAVVSMRADQRKWLDFAQRACTQDAEPMINGSYDEQGASCLVDKFNARSRALEGSRMIDLHRFFVSSDYSALPDPNEVDNAESYWKVATRALVLPQLDEDDAFADQFNPWMMQRAAAMSDSLVDADEETGSSDTSDSDVTIAAKEVSGTKRITSTVNTYWFGHGAAHGNWTISYLHYYVPEAREMVAGDIFAGGDWQDTLTDVAWAQLQLEHGEWLQVEAAADIAELVVDPTRWDLSNDRGLVIQFEPYEVSSYAYGAPTITVGWDKLDAIKADSQDSLRYGW